MKLYYVANARMPHEKAHGIQIAKTCESFIAAGVEIELVLPNRKKDKLTLKEFYSLKHDIPTTYLPVLNSYLHGRVGFLIGSITFMLMYMLFFLTKVAKREQFVIYSVDMDTFSSTPLVCIPRRFYSELHGVRKKNILTKLFFSKIDGVIAINEYVKNGLSKTFNLASDKILVEPNGVDASTAHSQLTISMARTKLSIPLDNKIALYVGRFYYWKGLSILANAAREVPEVTFMVIGGTKENFIEVIKEDALPDNLQFFGEKHPEEIPMWTAAADVLLVLGTKTHESSYYYTSPMKVFEYMITKRPIVSSATPAMKSILNDTNAYFYTPDDPKDLAKVVRGVLDDPDPSIPRAAYKAALTHTWDKRAERIIKFVHIKDE